jgi:uncharacterized protein
MEDKFLENLKEQIQLYFEEGGSHEFSHTWRVYQMAKMLAEDEKADIDIVKAAALLHDIARMKEDNGEVECHAREGAKMAKEILQKTNFPNEKIDAVCECIKVHRHSSQIKPETKEAAILQDADRLDALGAITIGRMFSTGGKIGQPMFKPEIPFEKAHLGYKSDSTIHGFHAKILKIKPETFHTKLARELAKDRYLFVEQFLERFVSEWEGKK